ncbi:BQ5605_C003g02285 [Microbotryum silenes-dioicae]|uniref:BQ5605_C003g02285 protein n=1 Tax=Microbotryum silenes-dioicae TaxID=796604 RepID=A0A2X0M196_9BASI|nr:BQ5605_C003g02285 [Microbotryum silenes-dioicae]
MGEPGLYRQKKTASDFYTAVTPPRSRKSRDSQRSTGGARSTPVTPTMLGQLSTHIATPSHVEGDDRAPSSGADTSEGESEVDSVGSLASPPYVGDSVDDLNDQAEVAVQDTMQHTTTNPMASLAKHTRERSLPLQSASAVHRVASALLDNNTA